MIFPTKTSSKTIFLLVIIVFFTTQSSLSMISSHEAKPPDCGISLPYMLSLAAKPEINSDTEKFLNSSIKTAINDPLRVDGVNYKSNFEEINGWTALHAACWDLNEEIVEWLLNKKADITITKNEQNQTPLALLEFGILNGYIPFDIAKINAIIGAFKNHLSRPGATKDPTLESQISKIETLVKTPAGQLRVKLSLLKKSLEELKTRLSSLSTKLEELKKALRP